MTGSMANIESILKEAGYHRNVVARKVKEIKNLFNLRTLTSQNDGIGKLYKEMILKFAS